ncbi:MAG TPA: FMN-binding protein [Desulfosarcina sp.]|nr:FMN-binding protein [Desulfosarcina sp.]
MSDQFKSIAFTAVVALVCSLLLTAAATGLKERKRRNVALDRQKNILQAVGLISSGESLQPDRIERLYRENIRCYGLAGTGEIVAGDPEGGDLPVCFHVAEGRPAAYIIPVDSRGLWGKIHGYMAIENDGRTVAGFSVYSHNETPGLGGEIEKPWFRENFVGKRIVDQAGEFTGVAVAKGKVADTVSEERRDNYVDGISGATLTGKYLTGGLRDVLQEYEPLARRFRAGDVRLPSGGEKGDPTS